MKQTYLTPHESAGHACTSGLGYELCLALRSLWTSNGVVLHTFSCTDAVAQMLLHRCCCTDAMAHVLFLIVVLPSDVAK